MKNRKNKNSAAMVEILTTRVIVDRKKIEMAGEHRDVHLVKLNKTVKGTFDVQSTYHLSVESFMSKPFLYLKDAKKALEEQDFSSFTPLDELKVEEKAS